jgi:RNA polymerase sigma-70 factor (ECF subfamily)
LVAQLAFDQDDVLIASLRSGDENAFTYLVDCHYASMVRVAVLFCRDQDAAEEVVQETWIAVLKGLEKFEARSSLKTWIFSILANKAKTRGMRESRSVAFSELAAQADEEGDGNESLVDPARFKEDGWWRETTHPHRWETTPEAAYQSAEIRGCIQQALDLLPHNQCQVITLRDLEGWSSEEVCNALDISETNQRVLLHRARSKVRNALERYFDDQ